MATQALAEVKLFKPKDCPMLNAGKVTPQVLQSWGNACHQYLKHSGKAEEEVVKFVADATDDQRILDWYHTNQEIGRAHV